MHIVLRVGELAGRELTGPNVHEGFYEAARAFRQMKRRHARGFVRWIEKCGVQLNHLVKGSRQRTQFADRACFAIGYCGVNEFKRVRVFLNRIPNFFTAFFNLCFNIAQIHV